MSVDDDDKPTVVLDLNALKKQKLKQEEDLANMAQELEFAVGSEPVAEPVTPKPAAPQTQTKTPAPIATTSKNFTVILFDFQSDFFQKNRDKFPAGYNYQVATTLDELNKFLGQKQFQVCVFNYDSNPKAVNSLTAQIKRKFAHTKTMIMAKAISPEKAKIHAATPSGANGYYQFPLDAKKIEAELLKIHAKK